METDNLLYIKYEFRGKTYTASIETSVVAPFFTISNEEQKSTFQRNEGVYEGIVDATQLDVHDDMLRKEDFTSIDVNILKKSISANLYDLFVNTESPVLENGSCVCVRNILPYVKVNGAICTFDQLKELKVIVTHLGDSSGLLL